MTTGSSSGCTCGGGKQWHGFHDSSCPLSNAGQIRTVLSKARTALKRSEGGMRGVCDVVPNAEAFSIIADCEAAVAAIDALSQRAGDQPNE